MIAQFAVRLICGMSLMWTLMPRKEVTAGFFRIQMLVVLGLGALAALTFGQWSSPNQTDAGRFSQTAGIAVCAVIAITAYIGSVIWTLGRRTAGAVIVFLIAAGSAGLLALRTAAIQPVDPPVRVLSILSELSSAWLIGAAVTSMLLGHWYLTAPTMSITPLSRLNQLFGAAVGIRLTLSAVGLGMAPGSVTGGTYGLWLTLRWIGGILGPLTVVVMVWRILKYRNTQSATGVLFVGVILTFIGEMAAALLFRELGIPL